MINLIAMLGEEAWKGSAVRRLKGYVAPSNYYNSMCTNQTLPTISLAPPKVQGNGIKHQTKVVSEILKNSWSSTSS